MSIKRIWKLGNLEHQIFPTDEAIQRLADILKSSIEDESITELIWGPDLDIIELSDLKEGDQIETYIVTKVEENNGEVTIKAKRQ